MPKKRLKIESQDLPPVAPIEHPSCFMQAPFFLAVILVLAMIVFVCFSLQRRQTQIFSNQRAANSVTITVGSAALTIETAATLAQQRRGLSGRATLAPDAGMFFPVDPPSQAGFWMKDMNFPLDFIYVYKGRVVETKENVLPSLTPLPFFPREDVDAVIEVNTGWVQAHGVKVGDPVGYAI